VRERLDGDGDWLDADAGHEDVDFAAAAELRAGEEDGGGPSGDPESEGVGHGAFLAESEDNAGKEGIAGADSADGADTGRLTLEVLVIGDGEGTLAAAGDHNLRDAAVVDLLGTGERGALIVEVAAEEAF
jgi:hypothetical protein